MSERSRLTIAVVVTSLLLVAVSIVGITLHTDRPAPAASPPISSATQPGHPTSTTNWHEEHD
jgi:hypothetical protein